MDSAGNILPIFDPAQTSLNPAYNPTQPVSTANLQYLRSQFPGNIIPPDRISTVAKEALNFYPVPNTDIGPFFQNNYFVNSVQTDDADGIIAKLDHPFREKHRITSNTTVSSGFLSPSKYFPNDATPTSPDQHFSTLHSELDYVYTASSYTVNSVSLALNSDIVQAGPAPMNVPTFPIYTFKNYVGMGTAYPLSRSARTTLSLVDSWSTRKGKHSIHLGGRAEFQQVNSYNPTYPSGFYNFTADITSLPGIINTGDTFAGFLLGLPATASALLPPRPRISVKIIWALACRSVCRTQGFNYYRASLR